jgi:hypothetical protein
MYPTCKPIKQGQEAIIINNSSYEDHKPGDPQDVIVVDSLDNNPVPEDYPVVAKAPLDKVKNKETKDTLDEAKAKETKDQEPERLWMEWAKTEDTRRDKTEETKEHQWAKTMETRRRVKAKEPEDPEPKEPRCITTMGFDNGTIHRRQYTVSFRSWKL